MDKILLISGCSYSDVQWTSHLHPDMDCSWPKWPELLAKKLDMKCINLSKSGAGQEYIYSSLVDTVQTLNINDIGLVIPAWSTAPRRDFIDLQFPSNYKSTFCKSHWNNDRNDLRGGIEYWIDRSIRYYYAFQNICENLGVTYRQVQMINLYKGWLWEQIRNKRQKSLVPQNDPTFMHQYSDLNSNRLLTKEELEWKSENKKRLTKQIHNNLYYNKINNNFIGWPMIDKLDGFDVKETVVTEQYKISKIEPHPNAKGQERIAQFIFDRLGYSKGLNKIGVYI